jgi:hypothetical protein
MSIIGWQVNEDNEQTRTNIHALDGIRTRSPSVQAIKAYASDRVATVTEQNLFKIDSRKLQINHSASNCKVPRNSYCLPAGRSCMT